MAVSGPRVYLIGGITPTAPRTRTVLAYDTAGECWMSLPDYPGPPIRSAVAIESGGFIYLFGGYLYDYAISSEVWRLDPCSETWELCSPMPEARLMPSLHVVDGRIYVLGGRTTPVWTYRNTVMVYDPSRDANPPSANAWTLRSSVVLPTPLGDNTGTSIEGDLFTLGSYEPAVHARFLVYSPRLDEWKQLPLGPFTQRPVAARVGQTLYALQADGQMWGWRYRPQAGPTRRIQLHGTSPDLGSFEPAPPRPEHLQTSAIATLDGRIYSLGGRSSGGTPTASAWVYEPSEP